jgi:hypothetical protein
MSATLFRYIDSITQQVVVVYEDERDGGWRARTVCAPCEFVKYSRRKDVDVDAPRPFAIRCDGTTWPW